MCFITLYVLSSLKFAYLYWSQNLEQTLIICECHYIPDDRLSNVVEQLDI